MAYHHLTYHDRKIIGALLESNQTVQEIALKLGRPKSGKFQDRCRISFYAAIFINNSSSDIFSFLGLSDTSFIFDQSRIWQLHRSGFRALAFS